MIQQVIYKPISLELPGMSTELYSHILVPAKCLQHYITPAALVAVLFVCGTLGKDLCVVIIDDKQETCANSCVTVATYATL